MILTALLLCGADRMFSIQMISIAFWHIVGCRLLADDSTLVPGLSSGSAVFSFRLGVVTLRNQAIASAKDGANMSAGLINFEFCLNFLTVENLVTVKS